MTQSTGVELEAASARSKRMSANKALWFNASVLLMFLAASTAPSPLYALYRDAWGFSALTLTLVFACYAFALLVALLVFGALSDYRGRRDVLLVALIIEIASLPFFWEADSVAWLFAARVLQGFATGLATSALSAGLLDLNRERGALLNSISPLLGMALGAVGAGALAQFAPHPTQLVFDFLMAIFLVQAVAALWLPETVQRRPGALASMKPHLCIPASARATFWLVLPVSTAAWSLGGFFTSLGPTLARTITGTHSPMVGGGAVAVLVLSGVAAVLVVRQRTPRFALGSGAVALTAGLGVTLCGVYLSSIELFFAGTVIAGGGFGATFNGSVRSLMPLAEARERAGLMSTFYVACYLAFSVPALIAGVCSGRYGLQATALGYGLALMLMASSALITMARQEKP